MILMGEQRQARGLSGHFGDRLLQGLYLGCQVDGANGVFKHLFTDVLNIFATPYTVKVVPDVYPLRVQNPRKGPIPSIDDIDMQLPDDEEGVTLVGQDVTISLPVVKVKVRRPTKLVDDDRRTGNNHKKPYRMITMDGDGEENHHR
jgi:hypothetical protein